MNETYVTLAGSAAIAVGIAAFARQRGWNMALPLIAAGALVGAGRRRAAERRAVGHRL